MAYVARNKIFLILECKIKSIVTYMLTELRQTV